ncbi:hypothetical protein MMC13_001297 [Lambiella insularis]|nr:hypothetical protein [Lambiella insularis]
MTSSTSMSTTSATLSTSSSTLTSSSTASMQPPSATSAGPGAVAVPVTSAAPTIQAVPMGAVAGGVVGGVAAIGALLSVFIFFCWRRRREESRQQMSTAKRYSMPLGLSTSVTAFPHGMDAFYKDTNDSPYTDTSPVSPTPSYQPYINPATDNKFPTSPLHDSRLAPSRSQRSKYQSRSPSRSPGTSPSRLNVPPINSQFPAGPRTLRSNSPNTGPVFRLQNPPGADMDNHDGKTIAELDAGEVGPFSTREERKVFPPPRPDQRREDYWGGPGLGD